MPGTSDPAIFVNAPVAKHLKILNSVSFGSLSIIETIQHGRAADRRLFNTVHSFGKWNSCSLKHCWRHIYHVCKLGTDLALSLDPGWPMNHHSIACSSKMRSNLLCPLESSIACVCPTNRVVWESFRSAPLINMWQHLVGRANNSA